MSVETILFGISILFFLSILACKAGYRFGVPLLLLFLGVGMMCGSDGFGIQFSSLPTAQAIGTVALCIILFSGGLDTKISDIKPVLGAGVVLATLGVVLTAALTGILIHVIFNIPALGTIPLSLTASLLLAATMSSTDSASVFSILRGKGLNLRNNLRPMLELESGSNDPMAYMLTITLIDLLSQGGAPDYGTAILQLVTQFAVGTLIGLVFGYAFVWVINKIKIDNASLYPILVLTACIFVFSASYFMGGNSYLAVYIGGVVMGNSRFVHKRSAVNFFDGLAWLSQLTVFLALGLLVNPHELVPLIVPGVIVSFLMIFVTRTASVFACLLPFKRVDRDSKYFISWVGLRGAVPIIFSILALAADVPHARFIFNIVFICTLVSLVIQGTTLATVAKRLNLIDAQEEYGKVKDFDMELSDDIKSVLAELTISEQILNYGDKLLKLPLPESCVAVLVKRDETYFVPTGKTELSIGDKVLLISDDPEGLKDALAQMGVAPEAEAETDDNAFSFKDTFVNTHKDIIGGIKDISSNIKNGSFLKF
ncbi:MAG: potassium/proton antiporter [Bacteroidales bacterium]|nr:potassium/proton antiporter [Bacteroidales bacterium]